MNITKIDSGAFYGCKNLGVAYYDGGQTKWNSVTVGTSNQPLTDVLLFMWTETTVSEDGKSFTVTPKNVENGVTVIIAFYNGNSLSETHTALYEGTFIPYTAEKPYDTVKVIVWESLKNCVPVCQAEDVEL